jgi:hypothetical protein
MSDEEYTKYRLEADRQALSDEVRATLVPDGPADTGPGATSGEDDRIGIYDEDVSRDLPSLKFNEGEPDLSTLDADELSNMVFNRVFNGGLTDLDPNLEGFGSLTQGPGVSARQQIDEKLGTGFTKSKFGSSLVDIGILDVVPGVDFGLAIDDLATIESKKTSGLDVSFEEEFGARMAIPLSILGAGAAGKKAGGIVGKALKSVRNLFPKKLGVLEQLEQEAKAATDKANAAKEVTKKRQKENVTVTQAQSQQIGDELTGFYSWAGDDIAEYLPKKAMNINLENYEIAADVKATMVAVTDNINIPKDVKAWDDTSSAGQKLADDLGLDKAWLKKTYDKLGRVDEEVHAARVMLAQSSHSLRKMVDGYSPDMTASQKSLFLASVQNHVENMKYASGIVAAPGRALNSQKIKVAVKSEDIARIDEVMLEFGAGRVDELAKALSKADTPELLNSIAKRGVRSKWWDSMTELYINSLLSGTKTLAINATGNALFAFWQIPERALGGTISSLRAGAGMMGGTPQPIDRAYVGESMAMMYGMVEGVWDGLKIAGRSVRTGNPSVAGDPTRIEGVRNKAISSENLQLSGMMGGLADVTGAIVRTPTTVMLAQDEFFKHLGRRMEINRQAYSSAMSKGGSTRDKAVEILRYRSDVPDEGIEAANDFAKYITFQNELGPNGRKIQALTNTPISRFKIPAFKFIVPFVRTPINIFTAGAVDRNPVFAPLTNKWKQAMEAGGAEADMAFAKIGSGTAIGAFIAYQASQGNITGSGPSEPRQRKAWARAGYRPYSIRTQIGEEADGSPKYEWKQYSRVEPISFVVGAVADVIDFYKYYDQDDPTREGELTNITAMVVAAVAENTTNKTFMTGLSDFFNVMEDPKRYSERWIQRFASTVVPNAMRDLSVANDPYVREIDSIVQAIKAKVPGLSKDMPPKRNVWGEPRYHDDGWFLGARSTFLPVRISEESREPIDHEIVRLAVDGVKDPATGNVQVFRDALVEPPSRDIKGVPLDEWQYDHLVTLAGQTIELDIWQDGNPANQKTILNNMVKSDFYKERSDENKSMMIAQIHRSFNQAAIHELRRLDEGLNAKLLKQEENKEAALIDLQEAIEASEEFR